MISKVLYEELTPDAFSERLNKTPIAYLPLGTLEWHGKHLPLGADGLQSKGFFMKLAEKAGGIVLPMLFIGPDITDNTDGKEVYGMDICGYPAGQAKQLPGSAYWVDNSLYRNMLEAILKQLARAGFKIVVAHGHGPSANLFKENIPDWSRKFGLKLHTCWREDETDGLGIQTDHAAANETSLMMYFRPELVKMGNLDQKLDSWPLAVSGKDPRIHASPQSGQKAVELQLERVSKILQSELEGL